MTTIDTTRVATVDQSAFTAEDLSSVPGLHAIHHRLETTVIAPLLGAWRGIVGIRAPRGLLLYGPPDPARVAFASGLAGTLRGAPGSPDEPVRFVDDPAVSPDATCAALAATDAHAPRPLLVASTDEPWDVDPQLIDDGALDRLVFVAPPDWDARQWRLETAAARFGLDLGSHLDELTAGTVGWTGGDIATLVHLIADRSDVIDGVMPLVPGEVRVPSGVAILDAMSGITPSASSWLQHAREMILRAPSRGRFDDLVAYLQRMRLA